mmetsp:Transcript_9003/g.9742  ORF Transcript_9003/g.9742 Transcript_9003/m.9742 type:complete len:452 (+) Transcript_9003:53-1408(+)
MSDKKDKKSKTSSSKKSSSKRSSSKAEKKDLMPTVEEVEDSITIDDKLKTPSTSRKPGDGIPLDDPNIGMGVPIVDSPEVSRIKYQVINNPGMFTLMQKKEQILAQMQRVDYRMEEIRGVKTVIERDIRSEYGEIMERLRAAEGQKTAILQHDVTELQKDLDRIDDIVSSQQQIAEYNAGGDMDGFLLRCQQIEENIEYCLTKPFKVAIEVYPNDLPRELAERRVILQRCAYYERLLQLKDEIIWKLIRERQAVAEQAVNEYDGVVHKEMAEWARLTDRFAQELQKHMQPGEEGQDKINVENRRPDTTNDPISVDNLNATTRSDHSQHVPEKGPQTLSAILYKVKQTCDVKALDLDAAFKSYDRNNDGYIPAVIFHQIMLDFCQLQRENIEVLIQEYDVNRSNEVYYTDFLKAVGVEARKFGTDVANLEQSFNESVNLREDQKLAHPTTLG